MKNRQYLLLLTVVCAILLACNLSYSPQSRSTRKEGLEDVTIWTNKTNYDLGEPVHIKFTLKNISGQRLILRGSEGTVMDISIDKSPRWSDEHAEQAEALTRLELQPGESKTIEWHWIPPPG